MSWANLHLLRLTPAMLLAAAAVAPTNGSTGTGTQSLTATFSPQGSLIVPSTATLTSAVTTFQPFTGPLTVSYRARTTPAGGGSITVNVSSDFTPAGGPTVTGGALQYTCSGATLGTGCSGTQTATTTSQTPVLTLPASACTGGGGACSSQDPNSINLVFTLADQPNYPTGSYSARVTFTISAI
jgi:hypothetical protein